MATSLAVQTIPELVTQLQQYHKALFSEAWVLLALARLYVEGGGAAGMQESFSETHLHATLKWAASLQTSDERLGPRSQAHYHNRIVHELGEFLLDQDPIDHSYRLSPYACQLCQLLHTTLLHEVRSTELIAHLRILNDQLTAPDLFIEWATIGLTPMMLQITLQLHQARNNVRQEIRQMQQQEGQSDDDYIAHLTATNSRLTALAGQTREISEAFARANEIGRKVNILLELPNDDPKLDAFADTLLRFIEQTNRDLRAQSAHIDRAQTLIQQLFRNLDTGRFNRLSEKYLLYLLRLPTPDDSVTLADIPIKPMERWASRYTYLRYTSQIYPPEPSPVVPFVADPEGHRIFLQQETEKMHIEQRALFWLNQLRQDVDKYGNVAFSEFATQVTSIEPEQYCYAVLAALLQAIGREACSRSKWQLHVSPQDNAPLLPQSQISIWPFQIIRQ